MPDPVVLPFTGGSQHSATPPGVYAPAAPPPSYPGYGWYNSTQGSFYLAPTSTWTNTTGAGVTYTHTSPGGSGILIGGSHWTAGFPGYQPLGANTPLFPGTNMNITSNQIIIRPSLFLPNGAPNIQGIAYPGWSPEYGYQAPSVPANVYITNPSGAPHPARVPQARPSLTSVRPDWVQFNPPTSLVDIPARPGGSIHAPAIPGVAPRPPAPRPVVLSGPRPGMVTMIFPPGPSEPINPHPLPNRPIVRPGPRPGMLTVVFPAATAPIVGQPHVNTSDTPAVVTPARPPSPYGQFSGGALSFLGIAAQQSVQQAQADPQLQYITGNGPDPNNLMFVPPTLSDFVVPSSTLDPRQGTLLLPMRLSDWPNQNLTYRSWIYLNNVRAFFFQESELLLMHPTLAQTLIREYTGALSIPRFRRFAQTAIDALNDWINTVQKPMYACQAPDPTREQMLSTPSSRGYSGVTYAAVPSGFPDQSYIDLLITFHETVEKYKDDYCAAGKAIKNQVTLLITGFGQSPVGTVSTVATVNQLQVLVEAWEQSQRPTTPTVPTQAPTQPATPQTQLYPFFENTPLLNPVYNPILNPSLLSTDQYQLQLMLNQIILPPFEDVGGGSGSGSGIIDNIVNTSAIATLIADSSSQGSVVISNIHVSANTLLVVLAIETSGTDSLSVRFANQAMVEVPGALVADTVNDQALRLFTLKVDVDTVATLSASTSNNSLGLNLFAYELSGLTWREIDNADSDHGPGSTASIGPFTCYHSGLVLGVNLGLSDTGDGVREGIYSGSYSTYVVDYDCLLTCWSPSFASAHYSGNYSEPNMNAWLSLAATFS